ncbi:MAG: hypothetical protein EA413_00125, partial [Cyanobium sp. PLM2.Bin73]
MSIQLSLLGGRGIRFLGCGRFGSGLLGIRLPLPRGSGSGFHLHLLAGLTDPGQTPLFVAQLIGQLAAQIPLAVAQILLGIQDLGLPDQGVELFFQLLLGPEHALVAHGLVLTGIGLHLGA